MELWTREEVGMSQIRNITRIYGLLGATTDLRATRPPPPLVAVSHPTATGNQITNQRHVIKFDLRPLFLVPSLSFLHVDLFASDHVVCSADAVVFE